MIPGVIYGNLKHDAITSSEAALELISRAVRDRRTGPPAMQRPNPDVRAQFGRLRQRFCEAAESANFLPPRWETTFVLMRFTDSFLTPPATEWAGITIGGALDRWGTLSRINADQEQFQIRGPATNEFSALAEEAGLALPSELFPDSPILFDEPRRSDSGMTYTVRAPAPVINREPVERWVGFVCATLKQRQPDALRIRWGTAGGVMSYGMATLDRDLFAASVLAIELAQLADGTSAEDLPTTSQTLQPPPDPPKFVFAKSGNGYLIRGFGEEGHLSALKGLAVLARLLAKPNEPVLMIDLIDPTGQGPRGGRSTQDTLDHSALAHLNEEAARLRREVDEAEDDVEREDSQQQLDRVVEVIRAATNIRGGSRDLNNPIDKLRPQIYGLLDTVYAKLRDATPPMTKLAEHFDSHIRAEGSAYVYDPPKPAPDWRVEISP